jgi:glycosidase
MPRFDHTTHDLLEKSLAELDLQGYVDLRLRAQPPDPYYPSPAAWEDQVLYFLLLDRFSDGQERGTYVDGDGVVQDAYLDNDGNRVAGGSTPLFDFATDAYRADRATWARAGGTWCGGTLTGLRSKLGYLRRLGVTAIWISPVFKQVLKTFDVHTAELVDTHSYHGYGIQNFLDVDPHFGTRQDLRDLVAEAHRLGIYVILDVILNHAGDVFQYAADRYNVTRDNRPLGVDRYGQPIMDPRWDGGTYRVLGYRNAFGAAVLPFGPVDPNTHPAAWPNDAIWPAELQPASTFTCKGRMTNYDYDPEYLEGDFEALKDIHQGAHERGAAGHRIIDRFYPSEALNALCEVYKFWIAFADIDGYRIDTVKHMEKGATRYFASVIHEFAQSIGKENFFLLGEITGGRNNAIETLRVTGLNAALGINDVADKLEYLPKGFRNAEDYFGLFANSADVGEATHTWFGKKIVTMFDDHDKVGRPKRRFCGDKANHGYRFLVPALALNLTTLGIPCIYYGSEQGFDGAGESDRFLRECMFGGPFGSLQSTGRHFFNERHPVYQRISEIIQIQRSRIALRRGRQYLRQISASGAEGSFGYPRMVGGQLRSVVPWSRIFSNHEILLAINTDAESARTAWVTIDNSLHRAGERLTCIYSTDAAMLGATIAVEARNGKAVHLTVPPAGFVVYE